MLRSKGLRGMNGLVLVICGLWTALVLFPASIEATDPAPEKSTSATGTTEQTPEQAAGGMKNLLRIRNACAADAKRMCAKIKPGGGRLLQCLHQHEADLSPVCRDAVGPRPSKP